MEAAIPNFPNHTKVPTITRLNIQNTVRGTVRPTLMDMAVSEVTVVVGGDRLTVKPRSRNRTKGNSNTTSNIRSTALGTVSLTLTVTRVSATVPAVTALAATPKSSELFPRAAATDPGDATGGQLLTVDGAKLQS
ncbi:unnamed protein product, partial [Nesidiocoris tenuis]